MSVWGKLAGAAAGLAIGGPIGALLGGLAGHYIDRQFSGGSQEQRAQRNQVAFTVGVIALGAKMAKADGVVSKDEVKAFKQVFRVPEGEADNVAHVFNLAKQDVAGYEAYADQLAALFREDRQLLEDVLEGLLHIASADDELHPAEDEFLGNVAHRFGFTESEYRGIRSRFVEDDKRDPYQILQVPHDISDADLKARYRKLVQENHPDRAIARGLPAEFIKIATDRLAAINEAYDEIRQERGLP